MREALGSHFLCHFHKCFSSKKIKRHAVIMMVIVCGRNGSEVIRKSIFKAHIPGSDSTGKYK